MPRPSKGCTGPGSWQDVGVGKLVSKQIPWEEPGLPKVQRTVLTYLPASAVGKPVPAVLVFHGWGGHASAYHNMYGFGPLAEQAGFLAVYPEGVNDTADGSGQTSWNAVGASSSNQSMQSCSVSRTSTGLCYSSCQIKKGHCHPCDWATCYDDVGFIRSLLTRLGEQYCVDLDRVYAYGCSNGGLMVHQLAQSLPDHFVAIAAACGGKPHRGYERNFKPGGEPVSMLLLQGRADHTIPPHTPAAAVPWWDGYYYAAATAVVNAYKAYDQCRNSEPRRFPTPRGVGSKNLSCVEYGYSCLQSSSVVECTFNAGHDVLWETDSNSLADGPETAWFFLCQHSRAGTIPADSCVLPQRPASLMQTQQLFMEPEPAPSAKPVVWHYLAQVAIGVGFLAFGLGVFCSHRRRRRANDARSDYAEFSA